MHFINEISTCKRIKGDFTIEYRRNFIKCSGINTALVVVKFHGKANLH